MKIFRLFSLLKSVLHKERKEQEKYQKLKVQCPDVVFQDNIQLVGNVSGLNIGRGSKVNKDSYLNLGGKAYGGKGTITLGQDCIIGSKSTLYAGGGKITFGNNCDIGVGVLVLAHSKKTKSLQFESDNSIFEHAEMVIGDNCNLASGSILIGKVRLGNNCIVAAGAVVSGVYEDNLILVGNPARPIPRI